MIVHPVFQHLFAEMGRLGVLPKTDQQMDRELDLEGICALPLMDSPEPFHNFADLPQEAAKGDNDA